MTEQEAKKAIDFDIDYAKEVLKNPYLSKEQKIERDNRIARKHRTGAGAFFAMMAKKCKEYVQINEDFRNGKRISHC